MYSNVNHHHQYHHRFYVRLFMLARVGRHRRSLKWHSSTYHDFLSSLYSNPTLSRRVWVESPFPAHASHDFFLLPRPPLSSTFQPLQTDTQPPFSFPSTWPRHHNLPCLILSSTFSVPNCSINSSILALSCNATSHIHLTIDFPVLHNLFKSSLCCPRYIAIYYQTLYACSIKLSF